MKITLMMVATVDGRTTKGNQPGTASWVSPEDQAVFQKQKARHDCIIMGAETYRAVKQIIKPTPSKPRIVLTRTPQKYKEVPGLVFSDDDPRTIIQKVKDADHKKVLLAGGSQTNVRFLDADLVDEMIVVVEPMLFGSGRPFVGPLQNPVSMHFISCQRLNRRGTLLIRYRLRKRGELYEH